MTPLRKRMIDEMVLAGLSANTRASYVDRVRALAAYTGRSPELLTEAEARGYLLHLRDERDVAQGTFQPTHAALRFLYMRVLDRDWPLFLKKESERRAACVYPMFSPIPRPAVSSAV